VRPPPIVSYTTKALTTLGFTSESTCDWEASQWTVPINLTVNQLLKAGKLPFQIGRGPRLYLERPSGGPDWGLRITLNFLLPKYQLS